MKVASMFSLKDTVRRSWRHLIDEWPLFVQLAWFWMACGLAGYMAEQLSPDPAPPEWAFVAFVASVAQMAAAVIFAVAWHRTILAAERPAGWLPIRVGRYELRYLWNSVKLGLAAVVPLIPLTAIISSPPQADGSPQPTAVVAFLLLLPILGLLFSRLGLIFPAAAVGRPMTFGESWRATRGHALKLFIGPVLISLPLQVAAILVTMAAMGWLGAVGLKLTGALISGAFLQVTSYAIVALVTGFLSYAYQALAPGQQVDEIA